MSKEEEGRRLEASVSTDAFRDKPMRERDGGARWRLRGPRDSTFADERLK